MYTIHVQYMCQCLRALLVDCRCLTMTIKEALANLHWCTTPQGRERRERREIERERVCDRERKRERERERERSKYDSLSYQSYLCTSRAATVVATSNGVLWALVSTNTHMCIYVSKRTWCSLYLACSVLARGFPKGTVPLGPAHVPFDQYHGSQMCPLESC